MIKTYLITGDCHADFSHFSNLLYKYDPRTTAIIILGDVGVNYYLNKKDDKTKQSLSSYGYTIYCIRGNHEFRPEQVLDKVSIEYDGEINGEVYVDNDFSNIRYLIDGHTYDIKGRKTLVIGGAYSIDKEYRLQKGWIWNPEEQLTEKEKERIRDMVYYMSFDLVLTHTCPFSWQPVDLFLPFINQNTIDNSTEDFLEEIAAAVDWRTWAWGHFHSDREYAPMENHPERRRIMLYHNFVDLEEIA